MNRFKLIPAVFLFLRRGDEVLLQRRANTGYQDGKYGVPSGHMDGGELASQAMCREALEEIGIKLNPDSLSFVHVSHRLNGSLEDERVDLFFETYEWHGEVANLEPEKCDELTWFSINILPEDIIPHVRIVLEKMLRCNRYSEYSTEPE